MKAGGSRVLLVALAAGTLGIGASLLTAGPGQLLRSELGQRVLGAVLQHSAPEVPAGVLVAQPGKTIPKLKLADLAGNVVELPGKHAGRPMLINVWASWCGPCVREMPELQRFSAQQAANGTQVVGIALDDPSSVRAFLRQVPVRYPILLDAPGPADAGVRLGNPHGVLPYSVLVDSDGTVRKQRLGPFAPGELQDWARD